MSFHWLTPFRLSIKNHAQKIKDSCSPRKILKVLVSRWVYNQRNSVSDTLVTRQETGKTPEMHHQRHAKFAKFLSRILDIGSGVGQFSGIQVTTIISTGTTVTTVAGYD